MYIVIRELPANRNALRVHHRPAADIAEVEMITARYIAKGLRCWYVYIEDPRSATDSVTKTGETEMPELTFTVQKYKLMKLRLALLRELKPDQADKAMDVVAKHIIPEEWHDLFMGREHNRGGQGNEG